jgi:quercetin dioxygenase-like cupin family protein
LPTANTCAILKASQLEVVRLVLHAGKSLPEHQVRGEITVLCIEGSVAFSTPGKTIVLNKDALLHVNGQIPHALTAVTDASLLVAICLLPDKAGSYQ